MAAKFADSEPNGVAWVERADIVFASYRSSLAIVIALVVIRAAMSGC